MHLRLYKTPLLVMLYIIGALALLYLPSWQSLQTASAPTPAPVREFHVFIVEYKSKLDGVEKEVYRFDPGSIVVRQGEQVRLHLHGFHGKLHHINIPALKQHTQVTKGNVATLSFTADRLGTFEMICQNHASTKTEGPMIGYISVVK